MLYYPLSELEDHVFCSNRFDLEFSISKYHETKNPNPTGRLV